MILIKANLSCPFQCRYCYQQPVRKSGFSKQEYDLEVIKKTVRELYEKTKAQIILHGGEPLSMKHEDVEELLKLSFELTGKSSIQTSGYLIDDDFIRMFKQYKTGVGISVDGPFPLNELRGFGTQKQRKKQTERSFENLDRLLKEGISASVIIVVHKKNALDERREILKQFVKELDSKKISGRLNPCCCGNSEIELTPLEAKDFYLDMLDFCVENGINGWSPFRDMINSLLGKEHVVCVPKDTLVYFSDAIKKISEIEKGDRILGNSSQEVYKTMQREYDGNLILLKPKYLENVEFTPEHPILIGKTKIINLDSGKYYSKLQFDKEHLHGKKRKNYLRRNKIISKIWKSAEDIQKGDYFIVPKIKSESIIENYQGFELNENLLKMCGWYVAEGWIDKSNIFFSLGIHEKNNIENLISLLEPYKAQKISTRNPSKSTIEIRIGNKKLAEFLLSNFGKGAKNKKVPSFLFQLSDSLINCFLDSYIKGDGCKFGSKLVLQSASKELIKGLQLLYLKIGIILGYSEYETPISNVNGRIIKKSKAYRLNGTPYKKFQTYLEDNKYYYFPLEKKDKKVFMGKVFNLETQEGIYCLPFIVHNCVFQGCDPFHTPSATTVLPDGSVGVCVRLYDNGEPYMRDEKMLNTRMEILKLTDCKDCGWFDNCHGGCAGMSVDFDWRRKDRFCEAYQALFRRLSKMIKFVQIEYKPQKKEEPQKYERLGSSVRHLDNGGISHSDGDEHIDGEWRHLDSD